MTPPHMDDVGVMGVVLRTFIVVACAVAMLQIIAINHPVRHQLSFGHVMSRAGICLVLASIGYATAESQWMGIPAAPRLWVMAGGLVWLNLGCAATILERKRRKR